MDSEKLQRLAGLLEEYYATAAIDLQASKRLEETLLGDLAPLIRRSIAAEGFSRTDAEDMCQTARFRILNQLRRYRDNKTPVTNVLGLAATIVDRLLDEEFRRNSPEGRMERDVRDRLRQPPLNTLLARWQIKKKWLVGFANWQHEDFRETRRYSAFRDDDTTFVQEALQGRHPANYKQVSLSELLVKLLEWVQTPLEEDTLAAHLVKLRAELPLVTVALPEPGENENRDTEKWLTAPEEPKTIWNWEPCWQAICSVPMPFRAYILLARDREELKSFVTSKNPCDSVAAALEIDPDAMQAIWNRLPLPDKEMALRYGKTAGAVHRMRCYYLEQIRKRLGEPPLL